MLRVLIVMIAFCGPALSQNAAPFASYHSASDPVLNDPHDLVFGPDGMLYIADKFANRVAIMDPDTLELVGSVGEGEVPGAHDVSFGPDGLLHVAATSFSAVVTYDLSGTKAVREGSLGPFAGTEGVLAHSNGLLYVMASGTGDLFVVADRENLLASTSGMQGAHDVAEAPDGTIWVADNFQRRLIQFSAELERLQILSGPEYGFRGPRYLDFNLDGAIIVADQDAHRVMKIDPVSGKVLGIIGSGLPGLGPNLFDDPEGVAVRGSEYYFADSDNNRIVKYVVALN